MPILPSFPQPAAYHLSLFSRQCYALFVVVFIMILCWLILYVLNQIEYWFYLFVPLISPSTNSCYVHYQLDSGVKASERKPNVATLLFIVGDLQECKKVLEEKKANKRHHNWSGFNNLFPWNKCCTEKSADSIHLYILYIVLDV